MKPSDIKKLIKECITEVLKEDLSETNSDKIWADRGLKVGAPVRDIYGNFGIVKSHFVDRIHLTISWFDGKESAVEYTWITPLIKEGFDPCSNAGPNVTGDPDFYRRTNAHMRQLEETGEHGRGAQLAGAGVFDPRTFGVNEYSSNTPNSNPPPDPSSNEEDPYEKIKTLRKVLLYILSNKNTHTPDYKSNLNKCLDEIAGVVNKYLLK